MNKKVFKSSEEWFSQADYDIETAKAMLKTGRYIYAIFMCHLSVEKALKGIYAEVLKKDAPKTHDLSYLVKLTGRNLPEELNLFVNNLNDSSVPTRYPEELKEMLKQYTKDTTKSVIVKSCEVISWLKKKL